MAFSIGSLVSKDTGESIDDYIDKVYSFFKIDFIDSKPSFHKRVGLKKYPIREERESTFWHFTTKGQDEATRQIDISRCERIKYPKIIIENYLDGDIKCWKNKRGTNTNILLYSVTNSYLVILSDRGEYVLPWTAYPIEYENRKRKLLKEYEEYKKNNS